MPNGRKWMLASICIAIMAIPFIWTILPSELSSEPKKIQKPKPARHLSGIFKLPGGKTATKDTEKKEMRYRLKEFVVLDILKGNHNNLVFWNKNLPSIKITKKRTVIKGVPPGEINQIKLTNTGDKTITVQVRIIPRRS